MRPLGPWPHIPPACVLVLPLGSTEQHGPHLPLDTDTRIAVALAEGLAARRADALVAPPLSYSASGEHAGFPGTLSLGTEVLRQALIELVRSADDTASAVVIVNGHGGNVAPLRQATTRLRSEGRAVLAWSPRSPVPDDLHAGRVETSVLLHLAPELVDLSAAVAGPVPPFRDLQARGVRALSPTGVLGDPQGATPDEGRQILQRWISELTTDVAEWLAAVRNDQG
jgi:mycofactocin precursor peptide peptidase